MGTSLVLASLATDSAENAETLMTHRAFRQHLHRRRLPPSDNSAESSSLLPTGWELKFWKGRLYYHNAGTGINQWERPAMSDNSAESPGKLAKWRKRLSCVVQTLGKLSPVHWAANVFQKKHQQHASPSLDRKNWPTGQGQGTLDMHSLDSKVWSKKGTSYDSEISCWTYTHQYELGRIPGAEKRTVSWVNYGKYRYTTGKYPTVTLDFKDKGSIFPREEDAPQKLAINTRLYKRIEKITFNARELALKQSFDPSASSERYFFEPCDQYKNGFYFDVCHPGPDHQRKLKIFITWIATVTGLDIAVEVDTMPLGLSPLEALTIPFGTGHKVFKKIGP